jgi:hypothetical protein
MTLKSPPLIYGTDPLSAEIIQVAFVKSKIAGSFINDLFRGVHWNSPVANANWGRYVK